MASTIGTYPIDKPDVLSAVARLSGIPTPTVLTDRSTIIQKQDVSQSLFPANPARQWILVYNPSVPQAQLALNQPALWGQMSNLIIGPGEAWFFATAQLLGTVFQGSMSVVGLTPGCPLFAWEA